MSDYRKRPIDLIKKKVVSKLPKKYIEKIYALGSNKTTREMPGGLIAIKINKSLKRNKITNKEGKILSISHSQVNRIFKKKYGTPVNVKSVFYLNEKNKKQRLEFCKKILDLGLEGKNIFFTDECKIDTAPLTGDKRRLSSRMKKNLKEGENKDLNLMNKPKRKFEKSIMVLGEFHFMALVI